MATPLVDVDVVARLASLLPWLSTAAETQNVSAGPVRYGITARPCVFVEQFGGTRLDHTDGKLRTFTLQVTILGVRDAYGATMAKALEVFDALDRSGRWTGVSGAVYIDSISEGATPTPLGVEDDESPRFGFVLSVMHDS